MAFKKNMMSTVVAAALLALVGCSAATGGAEVADEAASSGDAAAPVAQSQSQAPSEEDIAAAEAEWKARQDQVNEVLGSIDRATFIGESPTKGNPEAEVVVVKFSDFECPFCAVAAGHMKDFMEERNDEVLYVYKHLPLKSIHPEAEPASKASWAAAQQGQFWLYHNGLFASQGTLKDSTYEELAEKIGLDVEQFNRDRNSDAAQGAIDADVALADQLNLRSTPTFLIGGLLIPPHVPPESFGQLLDNLKGVSTTP